MARRSEAFALFFFNADNCVLYAYSIIFISKRRLRGFTLPLSLARNVTYPPHFPLRARARRSSAPLHNIVPRNMRVILYYILLQKASQTHTRARAHTRIYIIIIYTVIDSRVSRRIGERAIPNITYTSLAFCLCDDVCIHSWRPSHGPLQIYKNLSSTRLLNLRDLQMQSMLDALLSSFNRRRQLPLPCRFRHRRRGRC